MVFVWPLVIQPLIVAVQLGDTDASQSMSRRGTRASLGTEVGFLSTDTALATLPYLEHPDDTLAS